MSYNPDRPSEESGDLQLPSLLEVWCEEEELAGSGLTWLIGVPKKPVTEWVELSYHRLAPAFTGWSGAVCWSWAGGELNEVPLRHSRPFVRAGQLLPMVGPGSQGGMKVKVQRARGDTKEQRRCSAAQKVDKLWNLEFCGVSWVLRSQALPQGKSWDHSHIWSQ